MQDSEGGIFSGTPDGSVVKQYHPSELGVPFRPRQCLSSPGSTFQVNSTELQVISSTLLRAVRAILHPRGSCGYLAEVWLAILGEVVDDGQEVRGRDWV